MDIFCCLLCAVVFCTKFLRFACYITLCITRSLFLSSFCFVYHMVNENQRMTVWTESSVGLKTAISNGDDKGSEVAFHSDCKDRQLHCTGRVMRCLWTHSALVRCFPTNATKMFDWWGFQRDTDIDAWEQGWNVMRLWCPESNSPVGPFYMPFLRCDHELNHLRNLLQLMARVSDFQRLNHFESVFFERPYDWLYSMHDGLEWWQEFYFESHRRRSLQQLRSLGWPSLVMFVLSYRDIDGLFASVSQRWRSYEL